MNHPDLRRLLAAFAGLFLAVAVCHAGSSKAGALPCSSEWFVALDAQQHIQETVSPDSRCDPQEPGAFQEATDRDKYRAYLGRYRGPLGGIWTVFLQNGGLAIDIPARTTYALRDPDEKGVWFFTVSRDVSVFFPSDPSGNVTGLILTNKVRLPKKEDSGKGSSDVPERLKSYLGRYPIPMDKRAYTVLFREGNLAVDIPGFGTRRLVGPDDTGVWIEPIKEDRYSFIPDDAGRIKAMLVHETVRCTKIE